MITKRVMEMIKKYGMEKMSGLEGVLFLAYQFPDEVTKGNKDKMNRLLKEIGTKASDAAYLIDKCWDSDDERAQAIALELVHAGHGHIECADAKELDAQLEYLKKDAKWYESGLEARSKMLDAGVFPDG